MVLVISILSWVRRVIQEFLQMIEFSFLFKIIVLHMQIKFRKLLSYLLDKNLKYLLSNLKYN